jgi:outer membrane protein
MLTVIARFAGQAQNKEHKLSLKACIQYAIDKNLQYQQSTLDSRQGEVKLKQKQLERYPSLGASLSQGFRFGRNIDPYTNTFIQQSINSNTFSLYSNVTLFQGFKLNKQIKSSQYNLKASRKNEQALKNDIKLQVTAYYLDVLLQKERVDNAQSRKTNTRKLLEKTRLLVENGKVNKTEALELEAQLAKDKSELIKAENQFDLAKLNLSQYMNWEKQGSFTVQKIDIPDTLRPIKTRKIEKVIRENYERLPQIQEARYRLKSADFSLKAAKARRWPSLQFNASISSGYSSRNKTPESYTRSLDTVGYVESSEDLVLRPSLEPDFQTVPFFDQVDNNFSQVMTFRLNIPVFRNHAIQRQIENAKIQQDKARINLSKAKQSLSKQIRKAFVQARNYFEEYQAARRQLASQKALFEKANLQYEEGGMSFYDWQTNKNSLKQSRNKFLQSKYQYLINKKLYEFYLGKPMSLNENP